MITGSGGHLCSLSAHFQLLVNTYFFICDWFLGETFKNFSYWVRGIADCFPKDCSKIHAHSCLGLLGLSRPIRVRLCICASFYRQTWITLCDLIEHDYIPIISQLGTYISFASNYFFIIFTHQLLESLSLFTHNLQEIIGNFHILTNISVLLLESSL